jgi:glycosyltransferase involved in cell wall biosynthesis
MRVILVSFSFVKGGAAIAANKFKLILQKTEAGVRVESICQEKAGSFHFIKRVLAFCLVKLQWDGNPVKHSLNLFSYPPVLKSFKCNSDAVHHLHWINNDTLSVFDFEKIPAGSIITMHDEWLYCGAEHYYKVQQNSNEFQKQYRYFNGDTKGIHWNYIVWKIKSEKLAHRGDLIYTIPSRWMFKRASASTMLNRADIRYLPNPIDTSAFKAASSSDIDSFKTDYSIQNNNIIIGFGAIGGKNNSLKGADLLDGALEILQECVSKESASKIILLDFGGETSDGFIHGFRNISVGHIKQQSKLALIYSTCDFLVVPSRSESFGQVAAESLACGTPVVSYNTSGLKDIVIHNETGFLARPFEIISLAKQMLAMINLSDNERKAMGCAGRAYVETHFSFAVVSDRYLEILNDAEKLRCTLV